MKTLESILKEYKTPTSIKNVLEESYNYYVNELGFTPSIDQLKDDMIFNHYELEEEIEKTDLNSLVEKLNLEVFVEDKTLNEAFNNVNPVVVKRICLKYVMENGYMSGAYGYHNNNGTSYRQSPTASEIIKILNNLDDEKEVYMCSMKEYDEMDNWVARLQPEGNYADYQRKCIDMWYKGTYDKNDISILASFCSSFLNNKRYLADQEIKRQRAEEHNREVESESNLWNGAIGDTISFEVYSAQIKTWIQPNYYNSSAYPMYEIKDTEGRTYTWGSTSGEVELNAGDKVTGKVKALNEFRGIKQTKLVRVKINEKDPVLKEDFRVVFTESFDRNYLRDLEKKLYDKLNANYVYPEDGTFSEGENEDELNLDLYISGDWKHDHLFCDYLVDEFCEENNLNLVYEDQQTLDNSEDDSYYAVHNYIIKVKAEEVKEDNEVVNEETEIVNEENLEETYSEEELNDMIGKVYNLQKVEKIFRKEKYGEPRLFARTVCVNCGREKDVFLSNLVNDKEKYGSCICSDTNIDSNIEYAQELYNGTRKLSSNTSGYTGVSFVKNYQGQPYNKWRAYIEVDGKRTYLGDFDAKKDAIKARKEAGEKGIKWYKENRNKLMRNMRRKTKKYKHSKYRDTARKTFTIKKKKK